MAESERSNAGYTPSLDARQRPYQSDFAALAARRRYRVDLAGHIACCEGNYARLLKLLPNLAEGDSWNFDLEISPQHRWKTDIQVVDRARYTTTLEIDQQELFLNAGTRAWGDKQLLLQVRLYHDAHMAEVLAWSRHKRLAARYDYPNSKMYLADEKAQCNLFLSEWLDNSLQYGLSRQALNLPGQGDMAL